MVLSDRLYSSVVGHGHAELDEGDLRPIDVAVKEFADRAWLWLPLTSSVRRGSEPINVPITSPAYHADQLWLHAVEPAISTTRADVASRQGEAGGRFGAAGALERLLTDHTPVLGTDHPDTQAIRHTLAGWLASGAAPRGFVTNKDIELAIPTEWVASKILISFRTDDATFATHLGDRLVTSFGPEAVVRDTRTISIGRDFIDRTSTNSLRSTVLLAVIGPRWLQMEKDGVRCIDRPDDDVRHEIEYALGHDILVVPILIGDTPLPTATQLPVSISAFLRRSSTCVSSHATPIMTSTFSSTKCRRC